MSDWKARMPRTPPEKDNVHFVMAFKTASGARVEYGGELIESKAVRLFKLAQLSDIRLDEILKDVEL